jgi:hypothetical protein
MGRFILNSEEKTIFDLVRAELRDEYVPEQYRNRVNSRYCGHCHHASVAMYYLLGGKEMHYKIRKAIDELGITHYWLETGKGEIIDPTVEQYTELGRELPYAKRISTGVSYRKTRAALQIMDRVTEQLKNG